MSKNTIKLKKYLDINVEYEANAELYPGHLIELISNGKVRKHGTSGGSVLPMFALEDELQGKGIDDTYAANAPVQCWIPTRGDEVYAKLAYGQSVTVGAFLVSNGDGTLKAYDAEMVLRESSALWESTLDIQRDKIVGIALEAIDLSSSGAYPTDHPWVKIRII